MGFRQVAIHRHDARDLRHQPRTGVHHLVARAQRAGGDAAAIAAEAVIRAIDVLHRHPERQCRIVGRGLRVLQRRQQRGAAVPRHMRAGAGDVVAFARDDRNGGDRQRAQLTAQRVEIRHDAVEHRLLVAHQVHLVDGQNQLTDAQQGRDGGMSARLHQQTLARIHKQDRQICGRCTGNHVARVLMMPGRIGQDEAAPCRLEESIRDVDGHALLALGSEAIDQQGIVGAALHRAEAPAVALQRGHHVVGNGAAFEQQAPDQGGLTVIDAAAGEDAQKRVGHQK
jgi:hypothetical protein